MKLLITILFILIVLAYMYSMTGEQKISPEQAKKLIEKGAKVVDVRTNIEWNLGHFPGAFHIPATQLKNTKLPFSKDDVVIIYCNTGQRARAAAETLMSMGYEKTFYVASSYVSLL